MAGIDPVRPTLARGTVQVKPFLLANNMLKYQPMGPNEQGLFYVMYATPGAEHIFTVAGMCQTMAQAVSECDLLNLPPSDRREWLRDKANNGGSNGR